MQVAITLDSVGLLYFARRVHAHTLDLADLGNIASDAEYIKIAAEREHRAQAAENDKADPASAENVEALFEQHFRAKIADEGKYDHARYHDNDRQRGNVEQRIEHRVQQQTAAQSRARGNAVFENGAQTAHGNDVSGRLHSALFEHHKRCGREDKADGAVDDKRQPVGKGEGYALVGGGYGAEAVKRIGHRPVTDLRNKVAGHIDDRGQEIEYAVIREV